MSSGSAGPIKLKQVQPFDSKPPSRASELSDGVSSKGLQEKESFMQHVVLKKDSPLNVLHKKDGSQEIKVTTTDKIPMSGSNKSANEDLMSHFPSFSAEHFEEAASSH